MAPATAAPAGTTRSSIGSGGATPPRHSSWFTPAAGPRLEAVARRILRNYADAEDVVQRVFLSLSGVRFQGRPACGRLSTGRSSTAR
jgi:hypothetical protein